MSSPCDPMLLVGPGIPADSIVLAERLLSAKSPAEVHGLCRKWSWNIWFFWSTNVGFNVLIVPNWYMFCFNRMFHHEKNVFASKFFQKALRKRTQVFVISVYGYGEFLPFVLWYALILRRTAMGIPLNFGEFLKGWLSRIWRLFLQWVVSMLTITPAPQKKTKKYVSIEKALQKLTSPYFLHKHWMNSCSITLIIKPAVYSFIISKPSMCSPWNRFKWFSSTKVTSTIFHLQSNHVVFTNLKKVRTKSLENHPFWEKITYTPQKDWCVTRCSSWVNVRLKPWKTSRQRREEGSRKQPLVDPKQQQKMGFSCGKCARKYVKQNLCIVFA